MKIHYRPRAADGALTHRAKHMRRLVAADRARRSVKRERKVSRGQTLIIFALTFTILIGFLGLAIDTIRLYDIYARMQRAAEAGALAGVIYMPTNYTTNLTNAPGDNAVCRALQESFKNSFGPNCTTPSQTPATPCPSTVSSVEIAVCQVYDNTNALKPYDLRVTITENINVLFISALNVGPLRISATATAEFIPPVQIASDPSGVGGTGSWGTFGECSGASGICAGSVRNWAGNINGPGELKEQGDPLVSCEEGPSNLVQDTTANVTPEPYTTYTGLPTNHQQNNNPVPYGTEPTSANCTNPDLNNTFTGAAGVGTTGNRSGYAFLVDTTKMTTTSDVGLWVWNAPFNPAQPKSCNGRQGGQGSTSYDIYYEFNCQGTGKSSSPYPVYPGTSCTDPYTCTDPKLMFSITYSVYKINSLADPINVGAPLATFEAFPLMTGGCGNGGYMLLGSTPKGTTTGCVTSACANNWCPLGNQTGGIGSVNWNPVGLEPNNYYRVMVVASDYGKPTDPYMGWGGHSYSLKLCPLSGTNQAGVPTCTPPPGAVISGWNLSDTLFTFPGNGANLTQTTEYPLGVIDTPFNGRTIDVSLYDPGDLIGNNNGVSIYAVAPPLGLADPCSATQAQLQAAGYDPTPNGNSFKFPNSGRTTMFLGNIPGLEPTVNQDLIYNGLWKDEQITLPANYTKGAWTLCAIAPQLNDSDVLGIKVLALGQSPVHLTQ
ncbi:MAG TPA: TadE/TadG family type IV pilus assembly protein [Ktedonobacterales bacterium]